MAFKLADLFVEISAKGNLNQYLQEQEVRTNKLAKALDSGAFKQFADRQAAIAKRMAALQEQAMDQAGIGDKSAFAQLGIDSSVIKPLAEARREMTRMNRTFRTLGGEMSQGMGTVGEFFQKSVSRKMEPSMRIIQKQLTEATIKMRGWGAVSGTAFRAFVAGDTALGKVRYRLDEIQKHTQALGTLSTRVFATGTAAITGFVAAASPDTFNTLTLSFKLLAAQIGLAFIPYIKQAAYYIQAAAAWFRNLSDEQKDNIAKWALWAVGIAGGVMALLQLAPALSLVLQGIQALGRGIMFLFAHPVLAGLAALAAAFLYLKTRIDETLESTANLDKQLEKRAVSEQEFAASKNVGIARKMLEGGTPKEQVAQWLGQKQMELEKKIGDARQGLAEGDLRGGSLLPDWLQGKLAGAMGGSTRQQLVDRIAQASKESEAMRMMQQELLTGQKPKFAKPEDAQGFAGFMKKAQEEFKKAFGGGQGGDGKNPLLAMDMRPSITGVADAWKQAQMQVKSPLEMEILKVQMEGRDALLGIKNNTDRMAQKPVK